MDTVINHLKGMSGTHHIVGFKKFVILDGREYVPGCVQHRRVDITWAPGQSATVSSGQLYGLLADYKESGFRCIDTGINGLTSRIRLVKGDVSLAEEYRIKLETRHLISFFNHVPTGEIKMEFVPRYGEELSAFEKSFLPFLETIKDYSVVYGSDYAIVQIDSYYPKKKKAGHLVEFKLKKDLSGVMSMETMIKGYHKGGSVAVDALLSENWTAASRVLFDESDVPVSVFAPSDYPQTPSTLPTKACTECKGTGCYTPLIGPPEPCRACQKKTEIPVFSRDVSRLFSEHLYTLLRPKVKSAKTYGYHWQTCCADIGCSKDHDQPGPIAEQAAAMIYKHLVDQYSGAIAFEDVYGDTIPDTKDNRIHMRSNYQGVSAWVSMKEVGQALQFQFQVRVST